jgi:hypothetical protein
MTTDDQLENKNQYSTPILVHSTTAMGKSS